MKRRTLIILLAIASLCLVGVTAAIAITAWKVASAPVVMLQNVGTSTIGPISSTFSANGVRWTEQVEVLRPGESIGITRRTADLFLEDIAFQAGAADYSWREGGLATPGETLRVQLSDDGKVSISYSR